MLRKIAPVLLVLSLTMPVSAQEAVGDVPGLAGLNIQGLLNGTLIDNLFSLNSPSLASLLNGVFGAPLKAAAGRLNGALSDTTDYLALGPNQLLSAGISVDQTPGGIPIDVYDEIQNDVAQRFGIFVNHAKVTPVLLSKAAIQAETSQLYTSSTNPDGSIQPGYFTVQGAEQRAQGMLKMNEQMDEIINTVAPQQQDSLMQSAMGYNSSSQAELQIPSAATTGAAQVEGAAAAVHAAPSTQLAIKAMADQLTAQAQMNAQIEAAKANAVALEQNAAAQAAQAAATGVKIQAYNANQLTQINKNGLTQIEDGKTLIKSTNRITDHLNNEALVKAWDESYAANGFLNSQQIALPGNYSFNGN